MLCEDETHRILGSYRIHRRKHHNKLSKKLIYFHPIALYATPRVDGADGADGKCL